MNVDRFGRMSMRVHKRLGLEEQGILVKQGVINVKDRRLVNVNAPVEDQDATNKGYVDSKCSALENEVKTLKSIVQQDQASLTEVKKTVYDILNSEIGKLSAITLDYIYDSPSSESSIALKSGNIQHV